MQKGIALVAIGILASGSLAYAAYPAKSREQSHPTPVELHQVTGPVRVIARVRAQENVAPPRGVRNTHKAALPTVPPAPQALLPVVNQPDILPEDRLFLDHVLRAAPTLCREGIEQLIVRYPSASLRASDIERGQATASTMILRGPLATLPADEQAEMIGVIFHECGHVIDLGGLRGSQESGASEFPDGSVPTFNSDPSVAFYRISWVSPMERRAGAAKEDFASEYAMQDPFEDAAATIMLYALHERAFRDRATMNPAMTEKLAWLETYVFPEKHGVAASAPWDGSIVWDETKIPHTLTW